MRIGQGYDLHRLETGRPLILGGVKIPYDKGLTGHSDADVLAHAITDALLGAAALGSIGEHFPDTDPAYKGADSLQLLAKAYVMVKEAGCRLANIDATVIAQEPKLNPHIPAIRKSLAECLSVPVESISVKAKTNEGLGPEGRREAISVHAAVLIVPVEG
ncbi:MAG TPA: 2-C-methyl-D-erythritol 2,4-cyclodiphosphate synthase [Candidatus Hydrogenedentes bacterium]|nr:2-C-methyl-D-erythritol 2,4-cyclodiphosphate synthase [Candidatus Hydrogenedentota bacterium]HQE84318.1 2-C-methyl-D-erythritol 2,4-cyclodiphosphate synthase [Candidatus Hydrogenedentota bacterium]HQH53483.1 2-C-methyl-D-erythritol 2,4-cyclodiphosphate synthase [Candidatus Hydrogenedentota bacterium]HQM49579.1 2-C-methyl-D-erythritol 2,4-cyclodiphosphate synthase [Candidatus Hydrogenedentota bacterium]